MKQRFLWPALLLAVGLLWLAGAGSGVLWLAALWLVLLLPLGWWHLRCLPGLQVQVRTESTASPSQPVEVILEVRNQGWLPCLRAAARVRVENCLTGGISCKELPFAVLGRKQEKVRFSLSSAHCGRLHLWVEELRVSGCLGFLQKKKRAGQEAWLLVVPDTFPVETALSDRSRWDMESDEYSALRPGSDPSETFGLREYVPGDSLKNMHWKLSEKLGVPMVRQPGLPISNSLALLLDTGCAAEEAPAPPVMEGLVTALLSVAQTLAEQQIPFHLIWSGKECTRCAPVEDMEDLLALMPQILGCGALPGADMLVGRYRAERGDFPFARALVFALRPAREADTEETAFTLLCCAEKGTLPDGVVGFTPEDAPERLRYVEV